MNTWTERSVEVFAHFFKICKMSLAVQIFAILFLLMYLPDKGSKANSNPKLDFLALV